MELISDVEGVGMALLGGVLMMQVSEWPFLGDLVFSSRLEPNGSKMGVN